MATRKEYRIKLISKELLNADTCYLGFDCPEIASSCIPGQFVNITAGTMFLKRPFGIASVDKEKGTFNIGVKVVGKGTEQIKDLKIGTEVAFSLSLSQPCFTYVNLCQLRPHRCSLGIRLLRFVTPCTSS